MNCGTRLALAVCSCRCTVINAHVLFWYVTGVSVDHSVVAVFYLFDKSTKQKASLLEFCSFCGVSTEMSHSMLAPGGWD